MDMEKLNKSQIVLLTLFTSFVTSIATGIVTVTLMDQAPPGVTQTINRVVERTIETVVPAENQKTTVIKEQVIVKEEDLVVGAIEKNTDSVVQISKIENGKETPLGLGIILSKNGLVVTDKRIVAKDYKLTALYKGESFDVVSVPIQSEQKFAFLKLSIPAVDTAGGDNESAGEPKPAVEFIPVELADSDTLKLGQTAIALGGQNGTSAHISYIVKFDRDKYVNGSEEEITFLSAIHTGANLKEGSSGGPVINIAGEVIGINIVTQEDQFAVPANTIKNAAIESNEFASDTDKEEPNGLSKITEALGAFAKELKGQNKDENAAETINTTEEPTQ